MGKVTVFRVCNTPLPIYEIVSLLKNPLEDELSTLPPAIPKAGEIYLYRSGDETLHYKNYYKNKNNN